MLQKEHDIEVMAEREQNLQKSLTSGRSANVMEH
jgi:hypothetical protein